MKKIKNISEFANKKYGQNFLKDHSYIRQIIQSMSNSNIHVVEIGPGLGDLTTELVKVRDVTAFEVDKRLCEHLSSKFAPELSLGRFKLVCGDALERWKQSGLEEKPYDLVANLPYYLATHFILRALHDPFCQSILVMVQKEVANKFAAESGERNFSALSVMAESAGNARVLFDVPPEAFVPPPKVTSAVLSINKKNTLDDGIFEDFLRVSFAQPRKKLSKNLERFYGRDNISRAFSLLSLAPSIRPHEVTTLTYNHLYNILKKDIQYGQEQSREAKRQLRNNERTKKAQP